MHPNVSFAFSEAMLYEHYIGLVLEGNNYQIYGVSS